MADLFYDGDEAYRVEVFDQIEVTHASLGGWRDSTGRTTLSTFDGEITAVYPRKREVRIRYEDHSDITRAGEPKKKSARVPVEAVSLIARSE